MSNTQDPIHALIREAGGIVHSDGNIFFTNKEQFYAATSAVRLQSPTPQPPGFDAHDMATAAADGFRDGVASVQPPGDAREAFEALQFGREFTRRPDGTYSHPMVENDWREFQAGAAWQAAQASEPSAAPVAEVYRAHYGGRTRNIGVNAIRALVPSDKLPPPGTKLYAAPARAVEPLTEAIAAEREACAQLVESTKEWRGKGWVSTLSPETQAAIVAAIRARPLGITTTPAAKAGKDGGV